MIDYDKIETTNKEDIICAINQRIKKEREKNNYTQDMLTNLITASKPTIVKWENDMISPRVDDIIDLARVYNCRPSYLLCEYDEYGKENKEKRKLDLESETGLCEEQINYLKQLMNPYLISNNITDDKELVQLAFINYFILNSSKYIEALIAKEIKYENQSNLKDDPDMKYIIECQKILAANGYSQEYYGNNIYRQLFKDEIPEDLDIFINDNLSHEHIEEIKRKAKLYYNNLSLDYEKRLDFTLSNMFLDTVNDFIADFDNIVRSYIINLLENKGQYKLAKGFKDTH